MPELLGVGNFIGGQTTLERVVGLPGSPTPAMARISGYSCRSGILKPHGLCEKLNTGAALGATVPDQSPFVFRKKDSSLHLLARDSSEAIRQFDFSAGTWGAAGSTIDVLAENLPARTEHQVIFTTGGTDPKAVVYEPEQATGTNLRALGFKAPTDYATSARPTTSFPQQAAEDFWNAGSGSSWAAGSGYYTVDNTGSDVTVLTISENAGPDELAMKCSANADVILASYTWCVIDLEIVDDPQDYADTGWFGNDTTLLPSGYNVVLYSDAACTPGNELATMQVPQCLPLGRVHRWCFHLGGATGTVLGCAIHTSSNFVAPPTGRTFTLKVFGADYPGSIWQFCGAWGFIGSMGNPRSPWTDLLPPNLGTETTSAALLQRLNEAGGEMDPVLPMIQYCYCFRGIEARSASLPNPMLSNPSEPSVSVALDPWLFPRVAISLPGSPDVMTEYGDYVTHAAIYMRTNDIHLDAWNTWQYFKPMPIAGSITYDDKGYTANFTNSSSSVGCNGHDLVVGDAVRFRDGTGGVDPNTTYYVVEVTDANTIKISDIKDGTAFVADETGANLLRTWNTEELYPTIEWYSVPAQLEDWHDYPSSARYVVAWKGRVVLGCLGWDNANSKWLRPTAIQISSWRKPWSFPTTVDEETGTRVHGVEVDGYAETGEEMRAMLARTDGIVVWLDTEFFWLYGDDPISGYSPIRQDGIGCISARSVADCRSMVIWHAGDAFYGWVSGQAQNISEGRVDSSLIDWTAAHNAVYSADRYVFWCKYDGVWSYIIYEVETGAWSIRPANLSLALSGVCAHDTRGEVYAVTPGGDVVDLFGAFDEDYGATTIVREVDTQHLLLCGPGDERRPAYLVLELLSDQDNQEIEYRVSTHGTRVQEVTDVIEVGSKRTQYVRKLPGRIARADACKVELTIEGANAPDFYCIAIRPDPPSVPGKGGD